MSTDEQPDEAEALVEPGLGDGRVVVGVDDSEQAAAALRWALREGAMRGCTVEVVHSWSPPLSALPFGATFVIPVDDGEIDAKAREAVDALVDDALGGLDDQPPEVLRTILPGGPATTLIEVAETADLLVVGSHGRSRWGRAVLGSVAMACVTHASCPVVVVRLPFAE